MPTKQIPDIVVGRLPVYLRALSFLAAEGVQTTSSHELGKRLGISAAQIRKDLSHFGEFGKQGTGYNVNFLREQIRRILKVDREWPIALIGIGDLGRALAHYGGFVDRGFRIVALFDNDPAKIGQRIGELEIMSMDKLADVVRQRGIQAAMIAVPAAHAQKVAEQCLTAGFLFSVPLALTDALDKGDPERALCEVFDENGHELSSSYRVEPREPGVSWDVSTYIIRQEAGMLNVYAAGVKAILNYAPISLSLPEGTLVQHIDPVAHLQRMTYYL